MTEKLLASAQARTRECTRAVLATVKELEASQSAITLKGVAARAGVSRNFIYTTPDVLAAVQKAAERQRPKLPSEPAPTAPSSDASLRTRLAAALAHNECLQQEIDRLTATNQALVEEVIELQNPAPKNVTSIRKRRG
ncbi:hypothetical protein FDF08_12975 [Micrococcus luteus]|nr:hypothetical protein FDF08_12975 [Micrococcus luteus]